VLRKNPLWCSDLHCWNLIEHKCFYLCTYEFMQVLQKLAKNSKYLLCQYVNNDPTSTKYVLRNIQIYVVAIHGVFKILPSYYLHISNEHVIVSIWVVRTEITHAPSKSSSSITLIHSFSSPKIFKNFHSLMFHRRHIC